MAPSRGNIGRQFARLALVVAQHLARGQAQFDKVHHAALGEDQAQLGDRITQDDQHVLQHLRLFFGVLLRAEARAARRAWREFQVRRSRRAMSDT